MSVVTVVAVADKLSDKPSLLVCNSLLSEPFVEIPIEALTESSVVTPSDVEVRLDKFVEVSLVAIETA